MSAEKINQIEYDIGKSLKCNLKTGRLLFHTNLINIFRDQYNLNLNLIYNSKCAFDANMNSHLGQYFKFDICEYITRVGSLIYYIDSLDRYHLSETYLTNGNTVYKRFNDDSRLTLTYDTDNDNQIFIKDDNDNTLEFQKITTQSSNTMYYVLKKKTIKYKNASIDYIYRYENNRLISMCCSTDTNKVINFKYNSQGFINHIYITYENSNHENIIYGAKLKYDDSFRIVAINLITNGIEEVKYLLSYNSNNKLKYLANYKKQVACSFTYDSNYKLANTRYGNISFEVKGNNDLYASENLYVKNQIIYNYVRDNNEDYDISNITINQIFGFDFTYDNNTDYTIVTKDDSLNPSNNIKTIYYYDSEGKETSHFEVLNNSNTNFKNINIMNGVELLGSGFGSIEINGKYVHSGICSFTYNSIDTDALSDFITYHDANISRFNQSTLIYNLSMVISLDLPFENNFLYLNVQYNDYDYNENIIKLTLKQSTKLQLFTTSLEIKNKEIRNIHYKVFSSGDNNHYTLSNMYLSFGQSEDFHFCGQISNVYDLNSQQEVKLLKLGEDSYTHYTLDGDCYLSKNDIIRNHLNWAKSPGDYIFYLNNGKTIERVSESYILCYNFMSGQNEEIPIDKDFKIIVKQNDFNSNLIKETNIKFCDGESVNNIPILSSIWYSTTVRLNDTISTQDMYYDLFGNLILVKDEYGVIKHNIYDNYGKLLSTNIYDGTTLIKTINHTYTDLEEIDSDGFTSLKTTYSKEGLILKVGEKGIIGNEYLGNNYQYDGKNRLIANLDNENNPNYINHIRYNNKDEIIEEYLNDNSNISNHYYTYDNLGRITNYYKLNKLKKDSNDNPKVSFNYEDSINSETENVYLNNNNPEVLKYVYNKYGQLIEIRDENNSSKVIFQYNNMTNLLSFIQDYYKNTRINYTYDLSNDVTKIEEVDSNNNLILRMEKEYFGNYRKIKYNFSNKELYYKYYYSQQHLINPRLRSVENNYFTKWNTYNNVGKNVSNSISVSNNDNDNSIDYLISRYNVYLEHNNKPTDLKSNVLLFTSHGNNTESYGFSYLYGNKCNMISSYVLEKINNDGFINKLEYGYSFNDSKELTQDKILRYNSNNTVIKYIENNYTYDKLGNITSVNKKEGTNPNNITSNITNSFTYVNSLLTRIDNNHDNSYKTFEYDNYGNIITIKHYDANNSIFKQELFTYTRKSLIETYKVYNQYNELILSYKYYYNYNNVRYKKENMINHNIITFNVINSRIISDSRGIIYLYDENDSLLGFNYNDKTYTYIKDETGNIVSIISDGKEVVRYIYDGYGNISVYEVNSNNELVLNNNSSFIGNINPYRYKDYYYDTESKLYYLNSRYYSSDICRFISPDSIEYLDSESINGLNLYCYCYNNPISYSDPSGNLPQWAEWLIGGAVIGLAALGAVFLPVAAGVIFGAAFYGAVTSAVGGALVGGIIGGITGGWEGALDGAASGFMWGAISGAATGALTSGINIATGSVQIVGSAQKTGSLFHQFASNVQAGKMSLAVGRYSEIHLNRSKGLGIKGFRPDVTGVTKNGLRVVEVVSSSQTYASQVAKVGRMMGQYSHISNGLTLDALRFITSWFVF